MKKLISCKLIAMISLMFWITASGHAQSLFKDYTTKSRQNLMADTEKMSRQIVEKFDRASIERNQQKIYFYEYFSNLKKMVLYSSKLATYAEYKDDLKFAKENELFRGLPEKAGEKNKEKRTRFITEKYKMMKSNIKDEIDTYVDLIQISLDACEHLSAYNMSPQTMGGRNMTRVRSYFETSAYFKAFIKKRDRLARAWPGIEAGIAKQISLWQKRGLGPEDPVIDQKITEAVGHASIIGE